MHSRKISAYERVHRGSHRSDRDRLHTHSSPSVACLSIVDCYSALAFDHLINVSDRADSIRSPACRPRTRIQRATAACRLRPCLHPADNQRLAKAHLMRVPPMIFHQRQQQRPHQRRQRHQQAWPRRRLPRRRITGPRWHDPLRRGLTSRLVTAPDRLNLERVPFSSQITCVVPLRRLLPPTAPLLITTMAPVTRAWGL